MLNKNTWDARQRRTSDYKISNINKVSKFISNLKLWLISAIIGPRSLYLANDLLQTFTSKAHNNLQGGFPTMIGFVTLDHLFCMIPYKQKVDKGNKANRGWENTLLIVVYLWSKSLQQMVGWV